MTKTGKRPQFEIPSGRMLIADPYKLGYTNTGVERVFHKSKKYVRSNPDGERDLTIIPDGVIYHQQEEISFFVFRNGDNVAITRASDWYSGDCSLMGESTERAFLKELTPDEAKSCKQRELARIKDEERKKDQIVISSPQADIVYGWGGRPLARKLYPDIPIGEMIGLEGAVFNPQRVEDVIEEERKSLFLRPERWRDSRNKILSTTPGFAFETDAECCELLIADRERWARPKHRWRTRFPDLGTSDDSYRKMELGFIEEAYKKVLEVTPGVYSITYHPQWATLQINRVLSPSRQ